jgi:hypothetical protein
MMTLIKTTVVSGDFPGPQNVICGGDSSFGVTGPAQFTLTLSEPAFGPSNSLGMNMVLDLLNNAMLSDPLLI